MRALIVSADHFEDSELLFPFYRLQEEGLQVDIASIARGKINVKHGYETAVDKALRDVDPNDYDLLVLPGGKAPRKLRREPAAIAIAQDFMRSNKPVAAICHGPQILITAGVLQGRRCHVLPLGGRGVAGIGSALRRQGGRGGRQAGYIQTALRPARLHA